MKPEKIFSALDNAPFSRIDIRELERVKIGHAEDTEHATGCTVFIFEDGAPVGVDVRGGGPASRDTNLLTPTATAQEIHALLFAGGSAYGLNAAGGVMKFLEEKGIGLPVGAGIIPLVVQSDIFDLTCGSFDVRPDEAMAYAACEGAYRGNYRDGCFGVGTGATVGKLKGMDFCTKTGIGSCAVRLGEIKIGAVVVVNALGDVYDRNGNCIAGLLNERKDGFVSSEQVMYQNYTSVVENKFTGNTTIGVILTNAKFDKTRLTKIASMAQNGLARSIRPVHTSADGDTVYAVSLGDVPADEDMIGTLAAEVMSEAIECAVKSAKSMYGYMTARDFKVS